MIRVDRATRDTLTIPSACITTLTTPQPFLLDRLGEQRDFRGRGLLGRCSFVLPESRIGSRLYQNRPIAGPVQEAYEELIGRLARLPIAPAESVPRIHLEGEALDAWAAYADEIEVEQAEGGRLAGICDWASMHAGRAARLAGLFHLVRHSGDPAPWEKALCVADVSAACDVARWLTEHALVAFERMASDPTSRLAQRILAWVRRREEVEFTLRDLHQHHRNVGSPEALLPALKVLEDRCFIRRLPEPAGSHGRGRPSSPRYLVNPQVHEPAQKSHKSPGPGSHGGAPISEPSDGAR
jgi:hypothetical protein